MDLFRKALGESRILGRKFPRREAGDMLKRRKKRDAEGNETEEYAETPGQYAARQYVIQKKELYEKAKKQEDHARNMNPNGFWEMAWSVHGIRYLPGLKEEYLDAKEDPLKIVKVVSQGLAVSDAETVSKVLFLCRHPFEVAKSQEALRGRFPNDEEPEKNGEKVVVRSIAMYVRTTLAAARWFVDFPEVPFLVVEHEKLVGQPAQTVGQIKSFVGEEGDWESAVQTIDPKLKRSMPEEVDSPVSPLALQFFELVKLGDWQGIIDAAKRFEVPEEKRPKPPVFCTRLNRQVSPQECESCKSQLSTTLNYIQNAVRRGIDFANEPCLRDVHEEKATVEESVANNHWLSVLQ